MDAGWTRPGCARTSGSTRRTRRGRRSRTSPGCIAGPVCPAYAPWSVRTDGHPLMAGRVIPIRPEATVGVEAEAEPGFERDSEAEAASSGGFERQVAQLMAFL